MPPLFHRTDAAKAEVIKLLLLKKADEASSQIALCSKGIMVAVGRNLLGKKHPIDVLVNPSSLSVWQRLCVRAAVVQCMPARSYSVLALNSLRLFTQLYEQGLKGKLALARDANPNSRFTFHITTRWVVGERAHAHFVERARKTGGEMAVHKFICIPQPQDALLFLQRWAHVQRVSPPSEASCMMECGPSEPTQTRKWIIDLDGKLDDLRTLGFLRPDEVCQESHRQAMQQQVVAFGSALSHALHETCGFLHQPCYFALKSRHKPAADGSYAMLSWHMTLLAQAPYEQWRMAMQFVEKHVYPKQKNGAMRMSQLSDAHITRNSKVRFVLLVFASGVNPSPQGQFIQTLFSEKVQPGVPATGRRFTLEGIYTPDGKPLDTASFQEAEALALMATSMSLPVSLIIC
jgi:hypothetical protein